MLPGARAACPRRLVRARKWLSLAEEPNVLVVHLKRFDAALFTAKVRLQAGGSGPPAKASKQTQTQQPRTHTVRAGSARSPALLNRASRLALLPFVPSRTGAPAH